MRRLFWIFAILLLTYALGYLWIRVTYIEEKEVLFPEDAPVLYYLYRPASYLDQALTGTGTHIGPHQ